MKKRILAVAIICVLLLGSGCGKEKNHSIEETVENEKIELDNLEEEETETMESESEQDIEESSEEAEHEQRGTQIEFKWSARTEQGKKIHLTAYVDGALDDGRTFYRK